MTPYYEQDGITIYHGDCMAILHENVCEAALVVTSPPYNLTRKNSGTGAGSIHAKGLWPKMRDGWYPDNVDESEYQATQRELIRLCLLAAPSVAYNHKVRYQMKRAGQAFHPMDWLSSSQLWVEIVWDRGGGVALNCRRPVPSDERIYVLGHPKAWHDLDLTTVWRIPPTAQGIEHPCPFPPEIPKRLIAMFTDPGMTVLDPYAGSGTTLIEAKRLSRKAIGIEISEQFCEVAAKRLSQGALPMEFSA